MTVTAAPYTPACATDPDLWASTLPLDHLEAKDACDSCPLLGRCQVDLVNQARALGPTDVLPTGTWAGIFITPIWVRQLRRTPTLACDCGCGRHFDTTRSRATHQAHQRRRQTAAPTEGSATP